MSAITPKVRIAATKELRISDASSRARIGELLPASTRFPSDPETGGLLEWGRILWTERYKVLCGIAIGLALGLTVGLVERPTYSAKTELVIESPNADFLNAQEVSPVAEDASAAGGLTDVQTQLQVMQSDQMLDRVIAKLNQEHKLGPLDEEANRISWIRRILHLPDRTASERAYRIHKLATAHLSVRQVGPSRAVDVTYTSPDPQFAATFANTFAAEYIASNMEARWAMSERTGEGLMRRLSAVKDQLQQSQNALQEYAQSSGLLFGPPTPGTNERTDVSETRLAQLQDELSHAEADRVAAESRLETAQSADPNTVADVLNDDRLRDLKAKLTDLQREKADLSAIYTPKHEKVLRVQAQIVPLQAAFDAQRAAVIGRIRTDYSTASRREGMLKRAYSQQVGVVTQKNDKAIRYGILKHQVDSNQKLYESMLEQVNHVYIASAAGSSNVQVFSSATVPPKPNSPGIIFDAAFGVFFGFLGGSAYVLTKSKSDRTISIPGQAGERVQLRELGIIPNQKLDASLSARRINQPHSHRVLSISADAYGENSTEIPTSVEIASWWAKSGIFAESFRMLLASVMCPDDRGVRPRVMVTTSVNSGEGKTTVVTNLAIAMAEIGQRVLLIDADLRRPRLHQVFCLTNNHGLKDIAEGNHNDERPDDRAFIKQTFIPRLDVLTSGPCSSECVASLLYSQRLQPFLESMRSVYDTILIDTSPCLNIADARVIGQLSDAVILVTRAGRTTWEEGRRVSDTFAHDRIPVMGTVLNDLRKPLAANYYLSPND